MMARKLRDLEAEKELLNFCRIFTDSDDGFISVADMRHSLNDIKHKLNLLVINEIIEDAHSPLSFLLATINKLSGILEVS
jgi:Ca2+-binding EF-hand superfamily protein